MKKRTLLKNLQQLDSLPLPEKEKILAACEAAVPENAPAEVPARRRAYRFSPKRAVVLAMAALLMLGGGITVAAMEAKEYNEALDFFEEYNLSAEGFTRSEIKQIYRDIVSESFTYNKTEEALASGLEGYEIQSKPLDSDGLKRLWLLGYVWGAETDEQTIEEGVRYWFNQLLISSNHSHGEVVKTKNDHQDLWRKELDDIVISEVCPVEDKVIVAGWYNGEDSPKNDPLMRAYLLDSDSSVIWCKDYDSRMPQPTVHYTMYWDGNCTLFCGSLYSDYVWILTIDTDGNLINERYTEYDRTKDWIDNAIPMGDGYLLLAEGKLLQEKDGKIQGTVTFGNGDESYEITDMIEFNGLVYLSGRIVPAVRYDHDAGKWANGLKDLCREQFGEETPSAEEQLQFMKDHHTAVLLVCDPESGEPQQFYTVPGASGGSLKVSDKKLTWQVNRYVGAEFTNNETYYLATGIFANIQADIWNYVFNPYGQVVGEKDTGKSIEFEG